VRKFFSSPDGGVLIGANIPSSVAETTKPKIKLQLHAILQTVLQSAEFGGLGKIGKLLLLLDKCRARFKSSSQSQLIPSPPTATTIIQWSWFDPSLLHIGGFAVSRFIMKHSHLQSIIDIRRSNYQRLLIGIAGIKNMQPLFSELPDHVVPYMFPVIIESGEADFDCLKRAGVPI